MQEEKRKKSKLKAYLGWAAVAVIFLVAMLTTFALNGWNETGATFFFDKVLTKNFLGIPAVLLALLTLIGYRVLGRTYKDSILGALKTAIGVLLLSVGSGALISLAKPVFNGIGNLGANVTPLDPYLGWSSSQHYMEGLIGDGISTGFISWISYAFIIGFAVNILMVVAKKFTNCHSLMITGHVMLQQASIVVATVFFIFFRKNDPNEFAIQAGTFVFSGLILGIYWSIGSNMTIKPTQRVTNNAGFAIGHQQMLSIGLVSKISRFFGKADDSAENKKMSSKFKIFEDNIFTQALIISTLFFVLIMILKFSPNGGGFEPSDSNSPYVSWKVAGGAYWLINWFLGSLKLVAALLAIITGVRMFVTELQQSFQGISEKIIPDAVVAVDIAASYGFSPNSVTYGFVSGTIGQFIGVGLALGLSFINGLSIVVVVPLFITLFFSSGSLGVFANAYGGWKASIIVPLIFGIAEIILCSFALGIFANPENGGTIFKDANGIIIGGTGANPFETGYIGMGDWTFFYSIMNLITYGNNIAGWILFPVTLAGGLFFAQITDTTIRSKKTIFQKMLKLKITSPINEEQKK